MFTAITRILVAFIAFIVFQIDVFTQDYSLFHHNNDNSDTENQVFDVKDKRDFS